MQASARTYQFILCASAALAFSAHAQISIRDDIAGDFIDISTTGTNLLLHENEEEVIFTNIGNEYFPAGLVVVSNNGGISFNPVIEDLASENTALPSQRAFGNGLALLPMWDDTGNKVGGVFYQDIGDRYIVQWHNRGWADGREGTSRYQIQLFPDGAGPGGECVLAQFIYDDVEQPGAGGGAGATIGVQGGIGTGINNVTWSFNEAGSVDNLTRLTVVCPIPAPASVLALLALGAPLLRRRGPE